MKRNVLCALFLVLALPLTAALTSAQTAPEFRLGFKALADQLPAEVVGTPIENEYFNLSTGNSEQPTTKGLMVWRKADNWTAFTNGTWTWINGQNGVQSRLNTERFLWENTPVGAEAPRPVVKAAATQTPVPAAALVQGSGATAAVARAPAATATTTANTAEASTSACLACHGPFDNLVSATANYVWPNGDRQTPHRYVPHDSKDIPECVTCHNPHAQPPTASNIAAMGKADPSSCFSCHHTGDLQCGTCHPAP